MTYTQMCFRKKGEKDQAKSHRKENSLALSIAPAGAAADPLPSSLWTETAKSIKKTNDYSKKNGPEVCQHHLGKRKEIHPSSILLVVHPSAMCLRQRKKGKRRSVRTYMKAFFSSFLSPLFLFPWLVTSVTLSYSSFVRPFARSLSKCFLRLPKRGRKKRNPRASEDREGR